MSNIIDFNKARLVYPKVDISNVNSAEAMLPQNFMITSSGNNNEAVQNSVKFLSEALEVDVSRWVPLSAHDENAGFIIGEISDDEIELCVVALITHKSLSWHLADKDLIKQVHSKSGNITTHLFNIFYDDGFDDEFQFALNMQNQISDAFP